MHVPLKSKVDDGLSDASKAAWQDRALLWGAHLHFAYEDQLAEKKIPQYVFETSYKGTAGVITVK